MAQIVVITGATAGLGLSLSKILLVKGRLVIGISRTKRHWKRTIKTTGRAKNLFLFRVDTTNESRVRHFFSEVAKKYGKVDILINNAGYCGKLKLVEKTSLKDFNQHIASNLTGTFLMCKYGLPLLKKAPRSTLINISSMAGKRAVPKLAAYSAGKFGVIALSQAIAKEDPRPSFKCVSVCPGGMNTKMRAHIFGKEDAKKQQSADYVASVIEQVIDGKIKVESGGDIVIRHGKITAIHPCPEA